MRIRVTLPTADAEKLKSKVLEGADSVEKEEPGAEEWEAVSRCISFKRSIAHIIPFS